jgi:formylmethanofuran dehydrogenase subunit E
MKFNEIGIIHSPYKTLVDVPKAILNENDVVCELELFPEYEVGLLDVEQASHLVILYWLDKADRSKLDGVTPIDNKLHGVFATRSPHRPNPVALSVVRLIERKGNVLKIGDITALDGTPLIDIKPYIAKTDLVYDSKVEWIDKTGKFK